jgi:hypothetical protein
MQVSETVCKQGNRRGRFRLGSDRNDTAFSMSETGSAHRVHPLSILPCPRIAVEVIALPKCFRRCQTSYAWVSVVHTSGFGVEYLSAAYARRDLMTDIVAALGMLLLATVPVLAAGFAQVAVPDPNGPPLEAGIWYPSHAPASPRRLALYTQAVAVGGEVAGYGLPLVVMSPAVRSNNTSTRR